MVTEVYSRILDEDRKINAQKFEAAFYANPDLRKSGPPTQAENKSTPPELDLNLLIEQLKNSPELATTLAQLLAQ